MRAQIIRSFGAPDVFESVDLPDPVPGPGEVVVQIAAASVNPVDVKIRSIGPPIAPELPAVLGCDFAGTVETVGPDVVGFAPGDRVFGCAGGVRGVRSGAYAERIVADAALVAHVPAGVTLHDAAALPLVVITAREGLDRTGLAAGETVLVRGGSGGVGHVVVQLAKARGARVVATASSAAKADRVRALGADAVVLHREEPVEAYVDRITAGRGFDVVFDATGGDDLEPAFRAAGLNGRVAAIVSMFPADLTTMHAKGLSLHVVFMLIPMLHGVGRAAHGAILRDAAALLAQGSLRPLIDGVYPLDRIADAHRRLESGGAAGKILIGIGDGVPASGSALVAVAVGGPS